MDIYQQPDVWKDMNVSLMLRRHSDVTDALTELTRNAISAHKLANGLLNNQIIASDANIISIEDLGNGLDHQCFVVGWSGNSDGHAGLGIKDAIAILVREHVVVTIYSNWKDILYCHTFAVMTGESGGPTLHRLTKAVPNQNSFQGTKITLVCPPSMKDVADKTLQVKRKFIELTVDTYDFVVGNEKVDVYHTTGRPGRNTQVMLVKGELIQSPGMPTLFIYHFKDPSKAQREAICRDHKLSSPGQFKKDVEEVVCQHFPLLWQCPEFSDAKAASCELSYTPIKQLYYEYSGGPKNTSTPSQGSLTGQCTAGVTDSGDIIGAAAPKAKRLREADNVTDDADRSVGNSLEDDRGKADIDYSSLLLKADELLDLQRGAFHGGHILHMCASTFLYTTNKTAGLVDEKAKFVLLTSDDYLCSFKEAFASLTADADTIAYIDTTTQTFNSTSEPNISLCALQIKQKVWQYFLTNGYEDVERAIFLIFEAMLQSTLLPK